MAGADQEPASAEASQDPALPPRAPVWVLLSQTNLLALKNLARDPQTRLSRKLLRQLTHPSTSRPTRATSSLLRNGLVVAVPVDPFVLQALLGDNPAHTRAAANGLAADGARSWGARLAQPESPLAAADTGAHQPFTAKSLRSVVHGGLPESNRNRH